MVDNDIMTLSEVAGYLKVGEKTIHRMLSRSEIPSVKVAGQWRFLKPVIVEWLVSGMQKKVGNGIARLMEEDDFPIPFSRILKQELILTSLKGKNRQDILVELAKHLESDGVSENWQDIYELLLQREDMMTTAVGNGIAFPHPRNPEKNKACRPIVLIGISREGVDFFSMDGEPTRLFCLVYTDSEVIHLKLLARLNRMLRDIDFVEELIKCSSSEEVISKFIIAEAKEI